MIETMDQSLTHKKPYGDANRDRYHRCPDIDTVSVGSDASRLGETRLLDRTNISGMHQVEVRYVTNRDEKEYTSDHRCERRTAGGLSPYVSKNPNSKSTNGRNHIGMIEDILICHFIRSKRRA